MLDLIFPSHCHLPRLKLFIVSERDRPSGFCVFGSFPGIMRTKSFLKIIGPSGVQTSIPAGKDICIVHLQHLAEIMITYCALFRKYSRTHCAATARFHFASSRCGLSPFRFRPHCAATARFRFASSRCGLSPYEKRERGGRLESELSTGHPSFFFRTAQCLFMLFHKIHRVYWSPSLRISK